MRLSIPVLLMVMLAACSSANSGARPADVAQADVNVNLRAPLLFGSSGVTQAAFDVIIRNNATVPVKLRKIRLTSPAMVEYSIRPMERSWDDTLAPGVTKTYTMLGEAIAASSGLNPSEPLNVRAEIDFEVNGRRYRDIFTIGSASSR